SNFGVREIHVLERICFRICWSACRWFFKRSAVSSSLTELIVSGRSSPDVLWCHLRTRTVVAFTDIGIEHRRYGFCCVILFLSRSCLPAQTRGSTRGLAGQRRASLRTREHTQEDQEKGDCRTRKQQEGLTLIAAEFSTTRGTLLV